MYAYPFVVLLAAIWADQQEQPTAPTPPRPQPNPGDNGYGSLSRAEMVSGYGGLSRAEMVSGYGGLSRAEMVSGYGGLSRAEMVSGFGADPDPQHHLFSDVSSAAIALRAAAGRNVGHNNVRTEQVDSNTVTVTALVPENNIIAAKQIDDEANRLAQQAGVSLIGPFPGGRFRMWKNAMGPIQGPYAAQWHFSSKQDFGGAPMSRAEMVDGFGGAPMSRAEMVDGFGGAPMSRAEMVNGFGGAPMSRAEMVQYGGAPGSWEAAWYGLWYGGDPATSKVESINHQVMKIVKQILGWGVATKGPKLISLNSQRDALLKQGYPPNHPQVMEIEKKALGILQNAGLQMNSPQYQQLKSLGAQRDHLIVNSAGRA